jgi:hypothetical protein
MRNLGSASRWAGRCIYLEAFTGVWDYAGADMRSSVSIFANFLVVLDK